MIHRESCTSKQDWAMQEFGVRLGNPYSRTSFFENTPFTEILAWMKRSTKGVAGPLFLGIEGGGTRTVALLADAGGRLFKRLEKGPANIRLLSDSKLAGHLREIAAAFPTPTTVAIGLAGARGEPEWRRIRTAAAKAWPGIPCHATHDLETALAAARSSKFHAPGSKRPLPITQVLVLSGTGSCFYGRSADGRIARFGGWGHILGDKGSGYEIGLRALKAVVFYLDRDGTWSRLGQRILRTLHLNEPNELIGWVQSAGKDAVAELTVEVFAAATERDEIARDILEGASHSLAKDAVACACKLAKVGTPVQFVFAGSVLLKQPRFARRVAAQLGRLWRGAQITSIRRESAWGAVELARRMSRSVVESARVLRVTDPRSTTEVPIALSPTEQRNPRSLKLDRLPVEQAIDLMLDEDARIPAILRKERANIARVVRWIAAGFKKNGRLFYVGAGTSGRLGILDASECPPTFRTPPDMVQGIIAGGQRAIWQAVEGAEDDAEAGGRAIVFRDVKRNDVVVGVAASGRTPFVLGALREARRRGAKTVLLCFNPAMKSAHGERPHLVIAPSVGPEILTGSTRLKAGTATKLVLNMFTTLAMVRIGKVVSNLMVDLNASNVKLRDRAVRIVRELTGVDYETARVALAKSNWVIKAACRRLD
jgi:N-acetylmuramic acid 6-phosphate etherase